MDLHLFTSDVSGLSLVDLLPPEDRITALIAPGNRANSAKLNTCIEATNLPVCEHKFRGHLDAGTPRAEGAVSWMYPQIIHAEDLARYPAGILNMHGGKIPEYRGANVLQWAIINGESELGVTWHEIVDAVDAGPIWGESSIPIPPQATAADMRKAMIDEGLRQFPAAWRRFRKRDQSPRMPDLEGGRVWPPRRAVDGRIEPGLPERQVRDLVRALCPPWPAATVEHAGEWRDIVAVSDAEGSGAVLYRTAEGRGIWLHLAPRASR